MTVLGATIIIALALGLALGFVGGHRQGKAGAADELVGANGRVDTSLKERAELAAKVIQLEEDLRLATEQRKNEVNALKNQHLKELSNIQIELQRLRGELARAGYESAVRVIYYAGGEKLYAGLPYEIGDTTKELSIVKNRIKKVEEHSLTPWR